MEREVVHSSSVLETRKEGEEQLFECAWQVV